jgi:hypothetical protein
MANTYVDYTGDNSETDFIFNFDYLQDDHVKVKVNDVIVTNYSIVEVSADNVIRFDTAPASNASIRIYRDSRGDFSPLVDFVDGSVLTGDNLDEAYKHNLFVSQEASEGTGNELLNKKGGANYDAEGNKIINLGTPTDSTDAANKGYTDQTIDNAIALGGSPAIVSLGGYDVTAFGTSITKSLANWTNDLNSPTATGSTTSRSLADRFADVVNVLDFGADNTGTSDSTTAFTSAFTRANAIGLDFIYVPRGTYLVTSITASGCGIIGDGQDSTIIKGTNASAVILTIAANTENTRFMDFHIRFDSTSATGKCIELANNTHQLSFQRIWTRYGAYGIYSDTNNTHWMSDYTNIRADNHSSYGYYINGTNAALTTLSFRNCYANNCTSGFFISNCSELTMIDSAVDLATTWGMNLQFCEGGNILSSHFEQCDFGAETERALINLINCDSMNIDGVYSDTNQADTSFYALRIAGSNGARNIKFSNLFQISNTNLNFLYVNSDCTKANSNLLLSGVNADLNATFSGDTVITHLDYLNFVRSVSTDVNGSIDGTFPTAPSYLSKTAHSYVDDGMTDYYVSMDKPTSTTYQARLRNPDGTFATVSGIEIITKFSFYRF